MKINYASLQRTFQMHNPDYFDKDSLDIGCDEVQLYKYLLQTIKSPRANDLEINANTRDINCYVGESERDQIISFVEYTVQNGDIEERRLAALFYTYFQPDGTKEDCDWAIMPHFIMTGTLNNEDGTRHLIPDDIRYRSGTKEKNTMISADILDESEIKACICYADDIFTTYLEAGEVDIEQDTQWLLAEHKELTLERYDRLLERGLLELEDETGLGHQADTKSPSPYHFTIDGPSTIQ